MKFLKLGLADVLFFPDSDEIYTPNTNKLAKMGEEIVVQPNEPNGGTGNVGPNQNVSNTSGPGANNNKSNNTNQGK
jgi:hypothetical protein